MQNGGGIISNTKYYIEDFLAALAGIEEMPKSEIEKRKRNMESISRNSRREKRNVCFLVREEKRIKSQEICNFLQFREEKEKF